LVGVGLVLFNDSDLLIGFVLFDLVDLLVEDADFGHIGYVLYSIYGQINLPGRHFADLRLAVLIMLFLRAVVFSDHDKLCDISLLDPQHNILVGDGDRPLLLEFVEPEAKSKVEGESDRIYVVWVFLVVIVHVAFGLFEFLFESGNSLLVVLFWAFV
jgi:hypothetical protein